MCTFRHPTELDVTPTMYILLVLFLSFFFFNDTATTEIYTLSLHDALPIFLSYLYPAQQAAFDAALAASLTQVPAGPSRSEEHTSELQSLTNLVCRLLLEKKKK